jgi:plastocyanin
MRRLIRLTIIFALTALVVACNGNGNGSDDTDAGDAGGAEVDITISGFAYQGPATVSVGDTVTVTNNDAVGHTWSSVDGVFDSRTLAQGESFEYTFEEAGEFDYFCGIHPEMTGTITVEG